MSVERVEFAAAPDYETKAQVARRLNVSKRTIDNLMRQRRLPYIKLTSSADSNKSNFRAIRSLTSFGSAVPPNSRNASSNGPRADVDTYVAKNFRINARGQESG